MSNPRAWNEEHHKFIINNVHDISNKDLAKMFNKHFGTNISAQAIASLKWKLGLCNGRHYKYTEKQKEFILVNSDGTPTREMTRMFNEHFGTSLTIAQMRSYRGSNKIKCNVHEGKFKKNSVVPRALPIGSERVNYRGFIQVKVTDDIGDSRKNWKYKHHIIWEENNGPLPKGYTIIFADKNKRNFAIDNLLLVSRCEMTTMYKHGLVFDNSDLTRTGSLIAKLQIKTNEKAKDE